MARAIRMCAHARSRVRGADRARARLATAIELLRVENDRTSVKSTDLEIDGRGRAILASMLDALISIDSMGKILSASDSVERVFGYKPAELVGRNVNVLMVEPHRSRHDGYLERYRRTGETGIIGRTREF